MADWSPYCAVDYRILQPNVSLDICGLDKKDLGHGSQNHLGDLEVYHYHSF